MYTSVNKNASLARNRVLEIESKRKREIKESWRRRREKKSGNNGKRVDEGRCDNWRWRINPEGFPGPECNLVRALSHERLFPFQPLLLFCFTLHREYLSRFFYLCIFFFSRKRRDIYRQVDAGKISSELFSFRFFPRRLSFILFICALLLCAVLSSKLGLLTRRAEPIPPTRA